MGEEDVASSSEPLTCTVTASDRCGLAFAWNNLLVRTGEGMGGREGKGRREGTGVEGS